MSTRGWLIRIEDMLEAVEKIEIYTAGYDFEHWLADEKTSDAVVRNLALIGEAARHIPPEVQVQFPQIPWGMMRGFRNVLIHEYFGVDLEVVWRTVVDDLPHLKRYLQEVVTSQP
ncbi:MAG TPA: DUF86 domain-containing protein [Geobacterales bacterium]|nr:DUF86 domain-containing protein [Geobacterales bacterium]